MLKIHNHKIVILSILLFLLPTVQATTYNFSVNVTDNLHSNFTFPISINETMLNITQTGGFLVNYYNITQTSNITEGRYDYSINLSLNFSSVGNYTNTANLSYYSLQNMSLINFEEVIIGINVFYYNITNITNATNSTNETTDSGSLFNKTVLLTVEEGINRFIIPDASLPFNFTTSKSINADNGSEITISCEQFIICPVTFKMGANLTLDYVNLTIFIDKGVVSGNYTRKVFFTLGNQTKNITFEFDIFRADIQNITFDNLTVEERLQLLKDLSDYINRGILEAENKTRTITENITIINETIVPVTTYDFSFKDLLERALNDQSTTNQLALQYQEEKQKSNRLEQEKLEKELKFKQLNESIMAQLAADELKRQQQANMNKWIWLGVICLIIFLILLVNFIDMNYKDNNIYKKGIYEQIFKR